MAEPPEEQRSEPPLVRLRSGAEYRPEDGGDGGDGAMRLLVDHPRAADAAREATVLTGLHGRAGAPVLLGRPSSTRLVVEAPPGSGADAVEYRFDPETTVRLVARALRSVHDVSVTGAPLEGVPTLTVDAAIAEAERSVAAGIGRPPPDGAYAHMERARLLALLSEGAEGLPRPEADVVLCHGDPVLAAVRLDRARPTGWLGWDRAVLADRHLDLAITARSIAASIGPMVVPVLFEEYGLERPDPRRLEWYALLDELR